MNKFQKIVVALISAILVITAVAPLAFAADKNCFDTNGNLSHYCKLDNPDQLNIPKNSLSATVANIANILGLIAGILAVIFLIIGGINYISSEGDPKKVAGAKQTVTYAAIGLVVSIAAPFIVGFVISRGP